MTTLTVIGCGYLGAVHAACMAQLGHDVLGIDVDAAKVASLSAGKPPFFEPGFPEVLTSIVRAPSGTGGAS
jgi:UDPglucose 6-dehydrogenase